MSNVVEEKWGEMGGNGEKWGEMGGFLHNLSRRRIFACQSSNASALFVVVGAGIVLASMCPHGLLLGQFSLCLLLFVFLFVPDTMEEIPAKHDGTTGTKMLNG